MEGKYEFIQKVNKEVFFEIFIFFFSFPFFPFLTSILPNNA